MRWQCQSYGSRVGKNDRVSAPQSRLDTGPALPVFSPKLNLTTRQTFNLFRLFPTTFGHLKIQSKWYFCRLVPTSRMVVGSKLLRDRGRILVLVMTFDRNKGRQDSYHTLQTVAGSARLSRTLDRTGIFPIQMCCNRMLSHGMVS